MFDTVLVANRGEIAVRVIRSLRQMGIRAVAVYSDADVDAVHVRLADQAIHIGPAAARESYLSISKIIAACKQSGAQAVHPGYGFLSENADFAAALADNDITFIGPPLQAIRAMGDKISAKNLAVAADAPIVPGVYRPGMTNEELMDEADGVGYPLMVKAAAGGGGKGMRVVHQPGELADAIAAARREAMSGFGDDTMMLERYVVRPRHIEIQILADEHGTALWVGERECSLQRRHQKVIEECPSPALSQEVRVAMGQAAVSIAQQVGYVGAGTVEFITDSDATEFFFLEMNTRLQVEHPVTEEVYGIDLVQAQIRIAAGEPLWLTQEELTPQGHAIEARVYAEDPSNNFLPTGGEILRFDVPGAGDSNGGAADQDSGVRVDTGVAAGSLVTADYDPMVAKIIAHGPDRASALARLDRALARTVLFGFPSNIKFLRQLLALPEVKAGELHTGLIGDMDLPAQDVPDEVYAAVALATVARREGALPEVHSPFDLPNGWRVGEAGWARWRLRPVGSQQAVEARVRVARSGMQVAVGEGKEMDAQVSLRGQTLEVVLPSGRYVFEVDMTDDRIWIGAEGTAWLIREEDLATAARGGGGTSGVLVSPMPGSIAALSATVGEEVTEGQTLVVVEAMKMEHPLKAPFDGTVGTIHVAVGDQVGMEAPLVEVEPAEQTEEA